MTLLLSREPPKTPIRTRLISSLAFGNSHCERRKCLRIPLDPAKPDLTQQSTINVSVYPAQARSLRHVYRDSNYRKRLGVGSSMRQLVRQQRHPPFLVRFATRAHTPQSKVRILKRIGPSGKERERSRWRGKDREKREVGELGWEKEKEGKERKKKKEERRNGRGKEERNR